MQLDDRLYVELIPDAQACSYLQELTAKITPHIKGRPVDPAKWHVTMLHFGIAEHVYYDVQRVLPNISKTTFNEALQTYTQRAKKSLPPPTKLTTGDLELFGIKENVLVLNLEPNQIVEQAHTQALKDLELFLHDCGVIDTHDFMQSSINFKWALELRPHITLFRGVVQYDTARVSPIQTKLHFKSADVHGL